MKKETLMNGNEFDKALRLQSAILKRMDDLTLEEMDRIVNSIHFYNFDKYNILIRVIDAIDIKSVANSLVEDIYKGGDKTGTKTKKITMFPCLNIEFNQNEVRTKITNYYNNCTVSSDNFEDFTCAVSIKKGWNVFFKKIDTCVDLYNIDGERIPPTVPDTKIHIMCYYSKVDKEIFLH